VDTRAPISIAEWKAMQTENDRLRADLVDAGAVHLADEQSVRNCERVIDALRLDLARVEEQRSALQRTARELAGSVSVLEIERDNLKRLSETTLKAARALSDKADSLVLDLARVTEERDKALAEVESDNLTADLARAAAERDDLKEWKVLNAEFSHDAAAECGRLREALSVDEAEMASLREWLRDRTAERDGLLAGCRRIRRCGTGNVWHWSADPDDIAAFDAAIAACETPKAGGGR
jgi:chromosome segregation ATPase